MLLLAKNKAIIWRTFLYFKVIIITIYSTLPPHLLGTLQQ